MGREIRRVPPNWSHPVKSKTDWRTGREEQVFQPLYNSSYSAAMSEWIENHQLWEAGNHPSQKEYPDTQKYKHYAQWGGGPPDVDYYRPEWNDGEATWFQVYETVSEGTPVTPPFATQDELIDYLVANGDFWDQRRRKEGNVVMDCQPWSRDQAERFVKGSGWAPSLIMKDGVITSGAKAL